MATSKKRTETYRGYCPTQNKEERVEQTYIEVTTLGSPHPQYIDGDLFCSYVSLKGGECDMYADCPIKNGIDLKKDNHVRILREAISGFIDRAREIEFQFKNKSKGSQFGYLMTISGSDFESWKSELFVFVKRNLSEHDLYGNLLEVIESYKTKQPRGLNDAIGILNAIVSDTAFLAGSVSMKIEKEDDEYMINKTDVFMVIGHDEEATAKMESFLRKMDLNPIILREQANKGNTVIEKLEEYTGVDYGVILYTPCDTTDKGKLRARQNVVMEHGYLLSKLGRNNVAAIVKGDIELPSDISGVLYIRMDAGREWERELCRELRARGFNADANKI